MFLFLSQLSGLVFPKAVTGCDGYGPLGPASVSFNGFLVCACSNT